VQRAPTKLKGPILCLVGPPGVGKTSLGKSIAKATGREFVRMSLGGVRDEAEIRGHRRTYIGSMPGKVIQSMNKAEEVEPAVPARRDRQDGHGLPRRSVVRAARGAGSGAELDLHGSLSGSRPTTCPNVMFVTTANTLNIPAPLMDRMEIIRIAGYTEDEKVEIAQRHLMPKAMKDHGLQAERVLGRRERAAAGPRYTREAGVRNLEREARQHSPARRSPRSCRSQAGQEEGRRHRQPRTWSRYLGVPRFASACRERGSGRCRHRSGLDRGRRRAADDRGVMMPGKGGMTVTGNLRDVMKESISAAASYVALARPSISASSRRCSTRSATSTCTCRKARRRRMVRRRVSRWRRRSSRS
jgi:ATP-dependent Lon protease